MSEAFSYKKAEPRPEFLRIGLAGPSTSGKTVSALRMAAGFVRGTGKRVCLIDTENGRALKYAPYFDFDHVDFAPPFTSLRYLEAIKGAEKRGYGAIIVDSQSHEHEGVGGLLEQHEAFLKAKAGDDWKKREQLKFTAWIEPKSNRNKLIMQGIQPVQADLILCFRAKEKLDLTKKDERGKVKPGSAGWTPIGGEEFPFEMLSVMILPPKSAGKPDWDAESSTINSLDKNLIALLHGIQQINEDTGAEMKRLTGALSPAAASTGQQTAPAVSEHDRLAKRIQSLISASPDAGDLDALWTVDFKDDLARLKTEKPEYYDRLAKQYADRIAALAQPETGEVK